MSLSFDDRLLGEKVDNYCSSSEDERDGTADDKPLETTLEKPDEPSVSVPSFDAHPQTGPKGVIADYNRYKLWQQAKAKEKERAIIELAKKNTMACRTQREDSLAQKQDLIVTEMLEALDDDDEFLTEYRQNRMRELRMQLERLPVYKQFYTLTADNFVHEVDSADPNATVIVHIYEPDNNACRKLDECLKSLCLQYPHVKFCRIRASNAYLSYQFSRSGVPALVVYKRGEVIGNLLRVDRDLDNEFYAVDVENLLVERGFLPDKTIGVLLNARLSTDPSASS